MESLAITDLPKDAQRILLACGWDPTRRRDTEAVRNQYRAHSLSFNPNALIFQEYFGDLRIDKRLFTLFKILRPCRHVVDTRLGWIASEISIETITSEIEGFVSQMADEANLSIAFVGLVVGPEWTVDSEIYVTKRGALLVRDDFDLVLFGRDIIDGVSNLLGWHELMRINIVLETLPTATIEVLKTF